MQYSVSLWPGAHVTAFWVLTSQDISHFVITAVIMHVIMSTAFISISTFCRKWRKNCENSKTVHSKVCGPSWKRCCFWVFQMSFFGCFDIAHVPPLVLTNDSNRDTNIYLGSRSGIPWRSWYGVEQLTVYCLTTATWHMQCCNLCIKNKIKNKAL